MRFPREGAVRLAGTAIGSLLAALALQGVVASAPSMAAAASPHWSIVIEPQPTDFQAGDSSDAYVLLVRNDGGVPTTGTVSVSDALPAGTIATSIVAKGEGPNGGGSPRYEMACPHVRTEGVVTCTYSEDPTHGPVLAGAVIVVTITVSPPAGATSLESSAIVSGGGAPSASTSEITPIDADPAPFGLSFFDVDTVEESGEPDTQAGSHPFELSASLGFTVAGRETPSPSNGESEAPLASGAPKDLELALPPGLVGDPRAVPRCSQKAFLEGETLNCPLDTQVGTVKPFFYGTLHSAVFPLYDIVPPPGQPAELGFSMSIGHVPLFLEVQRRNGHYALTASLRDVPESGPLQGAILTLWGVPAAASHDDEREGTDGAGDTPAESCRPEAVSNGSEVKMVGCPSGAPPTPFLTLPSACQGSALTAAVEDDSWESPGPPLERFPGEPVLAQSVGGCEALSFTPSLALTPETAQAGVPSGYTLDVHVPQDEDPGALATPDLRRVVVSLPAGVVLSPSFANGLQACSPEQFEPPSPEAHATAPAVCPSASQIGTVKIATPLLASPLEGQIFLGTPACSPCTPADAREGRLIRLLVQAQGSGVAIKLEGSASIDQATGQLTASFEELPQLPFEDVQLMFSGGANAALANPSSACGTPLAAGSRLTAYSSETAAEPSSGPFTVSACPPLQFQPSFTAGTTNNQAGAFSPLTVTLSRGAQEEDLRSLSVQLPPGLLGLFSMVAPCAPAQAQAGGCGAESQLGTATIVAGPGPDPLTLGGSVYLTGPYEGAPFGLSIAVPVVAGPLDLGEIIVGARLTVNPRTAALTVTSDPLPQTLDGIPLQLRTVDLDIDRKGFVFDPTNCHALAIGGTIDSSGGVAAPVSSRFQAANCATLAFAPKPTALTHAHASRAGGAHLHVRIVFAHGQANLAKLDLELPRRLVVRLSTLQKACRVAVFDANPGGCPAASVVGSATVLTPVLRAPLDGPVYVLSRGGKATPEIALVLQGEGVVVEVVGEARTRHGVVSAAFGSLPDAPISELDVLLDAGPHGLLAANLPEKLEGDMCGTRMSMPSELTGQNGAVVKPTIEVAVSGCPRARHRKARRRRA
jgi:hypothetical protein